MLLTLVVVSTGEKFYSFKLKHQASGGHIKSHPLVHSHSLFPSLSLSLSSVAPQRWKTGSCLSAWCRRSATRTTSGSCSPRSGRSRSAGSCGGPTDSAEVRLPLPLDSHPHPRCSSYLWPSGLRLPRFILTRDSNSRGTCLPPAV